MRVEAEDNAHVLIDFGEARFASVTTGFTMQQYRSPAIELYGGDGVLQLLGDDWAPEGYELWRNAKGAWELFPESDPGWQWTEGLRHLVDCIERGREPVTRPEHAYHALEIMLAAQAAAADGRTREIAQRLPAPPARGTRGLGGRSPRPRPALRVDLGRVRWHALRWRTSAAAPRAAPARWRASSTRARTSTARRSCSSTSTRSGST